RQISRVRSQRSACEELRRESEALRQEWLRRTMIFAKEQRGLAERALALEQYRQQCISRATNPKAAEKRLERLRRRWATRGASAERALEQERRFLQTQAARLEEQRRQVQEDAEGLSTQLAELSQRQAAWQQQQSQHRT